MRVPAAIRMPVSAGFKISALHVHFVKVSKSLQKPVDLELGHDGMIRKKVKNTLSERKAGGQP